MIGSAAAAAQVPPRDTRTPAQPQGQTARPAGTASVLGIVTIAGTGSPARRARVTLSGTGLPGSQTRTTDLEGRFAFTALPSGSYSLSASKSGYLGVTYGQHRPGNGRPGTRIQLADGQKFNARLQLPRGGAITGLIVDENSETSQGVPVRAMRWAMQNGQRSLQMAGSGTTDDRGIYRIFNLSPGDYVVCATPRNDMAGEAERMMIEVEAMRRAAENVAQRDAAEARALTERVATLQAQIAGNPEEQRTGYAPICFPGTPTPSAATAVTLAPSEERTGVDFQLQLAPLARVEGTVISPTGAPPQNVQLTMFAAGEMNAETRSARLDPSGGFRFVGVPPGQYTITVRATLPAARVEVSGTVTPEMRAEMTRASAEAPRLWASMDVNVDGRNLSNVILQLQPGMTISGQVAFEGGTPASLDVTRIRVNTVPMQGSGRELGTSSSARVDANGRFTIGNVIPGKYRLMGGIGQGWFLESAVVGSQDTLDFPIEVAPNQNVTGVTLTFSDKQTEFAGAVINERNEPVIDYTVIVFPSDQRYWTGASRRIQTARPSTDGRFTLRGLPAGEYRLATVFDPEPGVWYDPAYLQQLQGSSTALTLQPGEKKGQDIRVASR
jgi:carboxypeptidase family protein